MTMEEQNYREIFDQLTPDPERVEALCRIPAHKRPRFQLGRQLIAAAVVLCLLISFGTSIALVETVDPSAVSLEQWDYSTLAEPIGASASSLGWTITVDGAVCGGWYT